MDDHTSANRANWDAWAAINAASANYDVAGFKAGKLSLNRIERGELGDVAGKSLLHLQCHFGIDTLSWARLGARVTGIDFSAPAIDLARSLAAELDVEGRFVVSTVEDLPANLDGDFDVVYTSRGAIWWLADLERWADVIAHFLRPDGVFYITEFHPILMTFDESETATPKIRYPYFPRREPM